MIGELFSLASALSFSTASITVRRGMRAAHDNGIFISIFISMVVFSTLTIFFYLTGKLPSLTLKGIFLFALAGLLTTFSGRSFHYAAIRAIGPSRATSFRFTFPILTVSLAFLFLSERFDLSQLIGAIAILGGVWILSKEALGRVDLGTSVNERVSLSESSHRFVDKPWVGILYALGSALSFGFGHFLRKLSLMEVPSPIWGLGIGTIVAWSAIMIQTMRRRELKKSIHNNFNFHHPPWLFILAGLLFTLGQMLNFISIYFTAVSVVVILASSEPLITLIISRLFLKGEESLNRRVIISSGVVCSGVILMFI
ncbi:MAG: hypothetical protein A2157_09705 [Deltaproteobacteria bacterium RBG_16_47_11]|nr:MAG: hypothetical protein A2157_09705 [Deltaproteobacteria bacterium RBG_16_47_11]